MQKDGGQGRFAPVPWSLQEEAAGRSRIDAYCIAVYAALRRFCDFGAETGAAVSDARAAALAGCSPRTFRDRRERLREAGWLEWESTFGAVNEYTVRSRPRRETPRTAAGDAAVGENTPGQETPRTAARDAAVEPTAARAAEGSARDAEVPRRELPTTESQHREPETETEAGSSSLRSSDPEPRAHARPAGKHTPEGEDEGTPGDGGWPCSRCGERVPRTERVAHLRECADADALRRSPSGRPGLPDPGEVVQVGPAYPHTPRRPHPESADLRRDGLPDDAPPDPPEPEVEP